MQLLVWFLDGLHSEIRQEARERFEARKKATAVSTHDAARHWRVNTSRRADRHGQILIPRMMRVTHGWGLVGLVVSEGVPAVVRAVPAAWVVAVAPAEAAAG